jgi:predicted ATPase
MDRINYYVNNYDFEMINNNKSNDDKSNDNNNNNNNSNSNDTNNNINNNINNNNNNKGHNNDNKVKAEIPIIPRLKGLYLFGEVGIGKTLLMDTFYSVCNGNGLIFFVYTILYISQ